MGFSSSTQSAPIAPIPTLISQPTWLLHHCFRYSQSLKVFQGSPCWKQSAPKLVLTGIKLIFSLRSPRSEDTSPAFFDNQLSCNAMRVSAGQLNQQTEQVRGCLALASQSKKNGLANSKVHTPCFPSTFTILAFSITHFPGALLH